MSVVFLSASFLRGWTSNMPLLHVWPLSSVTSQGTLSTPLRHYGIAAQIFLEGINADIVWQHERCGCPNMFGTGVEP